MRAAIDTPDFYYRELGPSPGAASVVDSYWVIRARRCRTAVEAALPDAAAEVYFNLGPTGRSVFDGRPHAPPSRRTAWVVGPRADRLLVAKETEHCDIVGVRLHPGVVRALLGVPAMEVHCRLVDLDALWGPEVEAIRERLAATADPCRRARVLDDAITARIAAAVTCRGDLRRVRAVCEVVARMPSGSTGMIARALGLTHRQLIELFNGGVGLKPKIYHRVRRLRRVFDIVSRPPRPPWAQVAIEAGYVDQAHLIHEFRDLTGLTPAGYERERTSVGAGFVPYSRAE